MANQQAEDHHAAGQGASPLSFAVISVEDIARSLDFYCELIGFDIVARGLAGPDFRALIGYSGDQPFETALLRASGCEVGQILLVEFSDHGRLRVRQPGDRTTRGLWNLNFYVADIRAVARDLADQGFELWSDPVEYDLGTAGRAIEVLFEAPDGVAINLVQPLGEPSVFTGQIRAEVAAFGYTRGGFTPVATTAHCLQSIELAAAFYRELLGVEVVLDEVLGKPETNRFLNRPADARSHSIFLSGDHPFGKLSLNQPLNYAVPERVTAARAPNIGYLAQAFEVSQLGPALARAGTWQPLGEGMMEIAGFASERAVSLACPGSGAAAWLVEKTQ